MTRAAPNGSAEHPRHKGKRHAARVLTLLGVLVAPLVVAAAPAQAATPPCNYVMGIRLGTNISETVPAYDNNGSRTWRCSMGYGAGFNGINWGVLQLQDTINLCYRSAIGGMYPISADGSYGRETKEAVRRVQASLRISADGNYGPQTAGAMSHWTSAETPYGHFYVCNRIPQ